MSPVAMTLEAAAQAVGGELLQRGAARFEGLSTDSRLVSPGQAFLALAGERVDGHAHARQAAERGAALLIVSRMPDPRPPETVSLLRVKDTRLALGQLARAWRRQVRPLTVAITGSVGKTTTKELTRAVVRTLGPTHATEGNFNNDIGLPLTVLAMEASCRYLVLEMGMNAPGEISYLTALAEPDVGVITRVAPVHLEGLGTLEAVAAAKGELLVGLGASGLAVIPADERLLAPHLGGVARERQIRFGTEEGCEVSLRSVRARGAAGSTVELTLRGEPLVFELPLVGEHNARNAAAAAAVGLALGVPAETIGCALSESVELGHRSALRTIGPWHVLDDCYNANPVAVKAALDTLVQISAGAPRIAVLGSMLELGADSERYHEEVGRHAATRDLDLLVTVGDLAGAIARGAREAGMPADRVLGVTTVLEAADVVAHRRHQESWILVKASRGAHLEGILEELRARSPGAGSADGDR